MKEEIAKVRKEESYWKGQPRTSSQSSTRKAGSQEGKDRASLRTRGSFVELGLPAEGQCYEFGVKKHRYPTDGTIIGHTVAKGSVPLMHE